MTMMGHTTINKQWGIGFEPFGRIRDESQLQKQWFIADEDDTTGQGRLACARFVLLLLAVALYHLAHSFACDVQF